MKKITLTITLFFLVLFSAKATTYYVSTTGNNANPGTLASPFATPNYAALQCVAGDIIDIRGGTYNLTAIIRLQHSNMTIRSHAGEWAILNAPVNDLNIDYCIYMQNPGDSGFVIDRLEIIGGYYYGIKTESDFDGRIVGYPNIGITNVIIKNCKIHNTGRDCIKITPASNNIKVLNCEIYNSGVGPSNTTAQNAEGIDNVNGDTMQIFGCYIHDIFSNGLYLKGGAANCVVENNLVTNCGEGGILLGYWETDEEWFDSLTTNTTYHESINGMVKNNIVLNCQFEGIGLYAAKNAKILNNTVVNCAITEHAALFIGQGTIWVGAGTEINPPSRDFIVRNNIFQTATASGRCLVEIRAQNGSSHTGTNYLDNNKYYKGGSAVEFNYYGIIYNIGVWNGATGGDFNSTVGNPDLNANYHLNATSSCINTGYNTITDVSIDYDGNARSATDIGADEYNATVFLTVPPTVIGTGVNPTLTINEFVNEKANIKVFPTYTNSVVYISLQDSETETVSVIDLTGKIIKTKVVNTKDEINVSDLPSGIYILKFGISNQSLKIVKY
jgi:parallel beta-helix repeat protein